MRILLTTVLLICSLMLTLARRHRVINLDERWVCHIKNSCLDCLKLSQCSWCQTENSCFSKELPNFEDFCKDNATEVKDFGLSFEETAQCACAGDELERHCYPPGVSAGAECSGRGECVCGRCFCNPIPDPDHPTKTVMGEFCEFDNFSCDGPKCNEGPYSLSAPATGDDDGLED